MTEYKRTLSEDEKITYIQALLYIIDTDHKMTAVNEEYLKRQAEEVGLDSAEIKNIKKPKKPEDLAKELKKISSIRLKRYIIREMIMLALADHELSDEEMTAIYFIGMKAGLKEDKISDFFLWAAKGLEWQIEGQNLVEKDL